MGRQRFGVLGLVGVLVLSVLVAVPASGPVGATSDLTPVCVGVGSEVLADGPVLYWPFEGSDRLTDVVAGVDHCGSWRGV